MKKLGCNWINPEESNTWGITPWAGKMNWILYCDWVFERTRWRYLASSRSLFGLYRRIKNSMIVCSMAWCGFAFFVFSIRQRIPENEFSDPTEWGWLNPSGGGFSTVADFAKVTTILGAVTYSFNHLSSVHFTSFLSRYEIHFVLALVLTRQH